MQIPKVPWLRMKKKRASSDDDTVWQRDEDSESESIFLDTPWDLEPKNQRCVCVAPSRSAATPLKVFAREGRIHVQCCSLDGLVVVESRLLNDLRGFTQPCKA